LGKTKVNCWHCGTELSWMSDSTCELAEFDYVSFLTCPKCESDVEVYHKRDKNSKTP